MKATFLIYNRPYVDTVGCKLYIIGVTLYKYSLLGELQDLWTGSHLKYFSLNLSASILLSLDYGVGVSIIKINPADFTPGCP